MGKVIGRVGLALLAASASAETQQTNVETNGAYVYYSRDDHVAGGKQVSLSVSIQPTWPPGSPARIQYSAQECTIDYCWEMLPGYVWCNCGPFSVVSSGGVGQLPDGAFDVSPQGVARLAVDTAGLTWSYTYGTCERLDLTWTPSGAFHMSDDRRMRLETPTEVYQGVGHDDDWQASVVGAACGIVLTPEDVVWSASVQKSHWVNVTRVIKP